MSQDLMEYPKLVEKALRHVVRLALARVAADGLPGGHHFYIGFRTRHPGVDIPDRLVAQYPDEMTVVLEHKFWGLEVAEGAFEVTLSFGGRAERLAIPFEAVTSFVDPSVPFGLRFGEDEAAQAAQGEETAAPAAGPPAPEAAAVEQDGVVALDRFRKK